jgi:hypothetical protein
MVAQLERLLLDLAEAPALEARGRCAAAARRCAPACTGRGAAAAASTRTFRLNWRASTATWGGWSMASAATTKR